SHRSVASRAPARRRDAARAARRRRRRAQPRGSILAPGRLLRTKLADGPLVGGRELRETLRDRRTLTVMVLFPLVVYPLVSLATVQALSTRLGRSEKEPPRVAIAGAHALAGKLRARLAAHNHGAADDFVLSPGPATA